MHCLRRVLPAAALAASLCLPAFAAGPFLFNGGVPLTWDPMKDVLYYTDDLADNAVVTHAELNALVDSAFAEWSNVPTSSIVATYDGSICDHIGCPPLAGPPGDITAATMGLMTAGVPNNGGIGIAYDDDGLITFGVFGAPPGTQAVATTEWATGSTIFESWAVFNLTAVDPADDSPPGANFEFIMTQTFGHLFNLAHAQVAGNVHFFGDNGAPGACASPGFPAIADLEAMYPIIDVTAATGTGADQATVEHPDDIASISDLYPTAGWPGVAGTITGTVFDIDGATGLGGVNVVARNVANPYGDAVTALSGNYTLAADDGSYTLNGLTPGATYTLHVEEIVAGNFLPHTPVTPLPGGGEEYWNGADETNIGSGSTADMVCDSTTITAVAGAPITADIIINDLNLPGPLIFADGFESGDTSAW